MTHGDDFRVGRKSDRTPRDNTAHSTFWRLLMQHLFISFFSGWQGAAMAPRDIICSSATTGRWSIWAPRTRCPSIPATVSDCSRRAAAVMAQCNPKSSPENIQEECGKNSSSARFDGQFPFNIFHSSLFWNFSSSLWYFHPASLLTHYSHNLIPFFVQGYGRGVSHWFREGATCMCAGRSVNRGALSKPAAHSASLAFFFQVCTTDSGFHAHFS